MILTSWDIQVVRNPWGRFSSETSNPNTSWGERSWMGMFWGFQSSGGVWMSRMWNLGLLLQGWSPQNKGQIDSRPKLMVDFYIFLLGKIGPQKKNPLDPIGLKSKAMPQNCSSVWIMNNSAIPFIKHKIKRVFTHCYHILATPRENMPLKFNMEPENGPGPNRTFHLPTNDFQGKTRY